MVLGVVLVLHSIPLPLRLKKVSFMAVGRPNSNIVLKGGPFLRLQGGHKGPSPINEFYPVLVRGILSTCRTFQNSFYSFGSGLKTMFSNLIWRTFFVSRCTLWVF